MEKPDPMMSASGAATASDDEPLRLWLQERLKEHLGVTNPIRRMTRRPCVYTSSFQIDELDLTLAGDRHLRLVLKDLSRDHMVSSAVRARPEFLCEPRREIDVYRWVLRHAPAGGPDFFGACSDAATGRFWLLLEQIEGLPLWQVGDIGAWEDSAAWIARFHQRFSAGETQELAARVGAIRCDREWYWEWLRRARQFAIGDSHRRTVLDKIELGFERVVERLLAAPQRLIHGEFYPSNVLIRARTNDRVCPVDWEMATLGPALIDVAALTAGWTDATGEQIAQAYRVAAENGSERVTGDFGVELDCCRLYLAVRMLGWSSQWEPPRDHAHDWLAEAGRVWQRLEGRV